MGTGARGGLHRPWQGPAENAHRSCTKLATLRAQRATVSFSLFIVRARPAAISMPTRAASAWPNPAAWRPQNKQRLATPLDCCFGLNGRLDGQPLKLVQIACKALAAFCQRGRTIALERLGKSA